LGCGASTHSIDLRFPPIQVVKLDGEIVETRELLELKYYYDQLKELLESEGFELVEEYGYYDKCSIDKGKEMILLCRKADHS
jgi:hypothetical protein